MACAVQHKPLNDQWQTLFGVDYTTLEGSCLFIKKLIAIAVSNVTYARNLFPEEAYGNRNLAGIKLKILTEGSECQGATKIINLIRGCYDAVEKKYLQQLKIGICTNPENTDEAVEAFNFRFNYTNDNTTTNSKENNSQISENELVVKATISLLKNIYFINEKLGDLPENSFLTLKLLYNDDITPPDYEPPGFQPSDTEKFSFGGQSVNIMLGKVATPYHSCKLVVKTGQKSIVGNEGISEDPLLSQNVETMNQALVDESFEGPDSQVSLHDKRTDSSLQSIRMISPASISYKANEQMCCPCKNSDDSKFDTVTCMVCFKRQHQICYSFLSSDKIPDRFICVKCVERNLGEQAQDDNLYLYSESDQEALCIIRKALYLCTTKQNMTIAALRTSLDIDNTLAKAVFNRLKMEGYITNGSKRNIQMERVRTVGLEEYFNVVQNQQIENKENFPTEILNESMNNLSMVNLNSSISKEMDDDNCDQRTRSSKRKRAPAKRVQEESMEDFSQNSRKRARKVSMSKKIKK